MPQTRTVPAEIRQILRHYLTAASADPRSLATLDNPVLATLYVYARDYDPQAVSPATFAAIRRIYLQRGAPREESQL